MTDWVGDVLAALGLLGGGIGFLVSRNARKRSLASEAAAAAAQSDATSALQRSAAAAERLTSLWEKVMTPSASRPDFEVRTDHGEEGGFVVNIGSEKAFSLTVHGYPDLFVNMVSSGPPQDLAPNESANFTIDQRTAGRVEQVEVAWQDSEHKENYRRQFWIT
ncbi:hypothetical protein [Leifsonia shinshuensis]|uniref:Uncharacterized protein n=1 Tax=Leifsonia shinshuensis TaxID=150026 RepID=A0A7G6YED8_9MICO|nr:hypothetical protein [Leifsonia shinshuensis]QNE36853.1 hypothetical protein F1C12_18190 [Leifsonia shinshuensis]